MADLGASICCKRSTWHPMLFGAAGFYVDPLFSSVENRLEQGQKGQPSRLLWMFNRK